MISLDPAEREVLRKRLDWFAALKDVPTALASLEQPMSGALHFVEAKHRAAASRLPAGAIVITVAGVEMPAEVIVGRVERPRHCYARLSRILWEHRFGVPTYDDRGGAKISRDASIGADCCIGAGAVVDAGAVVGAGCRIGVGAYIAPGVVIGRDCRIEAGSRIGVDGFGYGFDAAGRGVKIAHLGGARLGDEVDIGANSVVAAGTFLPTIIGAGTKIDGHVYIGHNATIGSDVQIMAGSVVGGSAHVLDFAVVNAGSQVRGKITVGRGANVGLGSVVVKPVAAGETVLGDVAGEIRERLRRQARLNSLAGG